MDKLGEGTFGQVQRTWKKGARLTTYQRGMESHVQKGQQSICSQEDLDAQ